MLSNQPFSGLLLPAYPWNRYGTLLQAYFRSGWAFLIPYLAAYLLYAWLKWPANPVAAGSSTVVGGQWTVVPCLLHVYWALHAIHLMLGAIALRAWWLGFSVLRSPFSVLQTAAPWILLGLLFWIPGVYLEFPADPWAHYARVNEWSSLELVAQHSTWKKSSYFLAYSLIGHVTPPLLQLKWFDVYYTGGCLLLCWQYYRLARAVGLGECASFIFVLIQAITFGNDIFGFYRYYGMSSSLFAQLGAVALIRIMLEVLRESPQQAIANRPLLAAPKPGEGGSSSPATLPLDSLPGRSLARRPEPRHLVSQKSDAGGSPALVEWAQAGVSCSLLVALAAFNHVQGLGIAALGILAVGVWRLIEWRRLMIGWLAMGAVGLSAATILWYPRHPVLDEFYRPWGWLTAWYGFNLFSTTSPAFDRAAQIIGLSGLINFVAGLYLLRRNHLAGWLTVMPIAALCLPFIAIPFANARAQTGAGDIIVYNRMLLGIPAGLALVLLGNKLLRIASTQFYGLDDIRCVLLKTVKPIPAIAVILLTTLAVPASAPFYNRAWNTLSIAPEDLQMRPLVAQLGKSPFAIAGDKQAPHLVTTRGLGFITWSTGNRQGGESYKYRVVFPVYPDGIPSTIAETIFGNVIANSTVEKNGSLLVPQPLNLKTPLSMAGYLSKHWPPQQIALDYTGASELETIVCQQGGRKAHENDLTYYIFSDPAAK